MEIIWTKLAKITYLEILENLDRNWTKKEIKNFVRFTNELVENIQRERIIHEFINEDLSIQKCIVHKNVSLFYKKDSINKKIYLVTFFNNRMNPDTLKKLLNQ